MTYRLETLSDDEFGAVAVVRDESGEIVAAASSGISDGVETFVDEAAVWHLTGELLPSQSWTLRKPR